MRKDGRKKLKIVCNDQQNYDNFYVKIVLDIL
jgi:hypothetical protein